MMEYIVRLQDLKTYRYYVYSFNEIGEMVKFLKDYANNKEFEITIESKETMAANIRKELK